MRSSTRQLAAYLRGILVAIAATLGLALALVVGTQAGTAAAATFMWSGVTGVPVTPPANAGSKPEALFAGGLSHGGLLCRRRLHRDKNGNQEAMVAPRTNGSWGQAVEITLPAGAATSGQVAGLRLLSHGRVYRAGRLRRRRSLHDGRWRRSGRWL